MEAGARVLLTRRQWDDFGELFRAAAPEVDFVRMHDDGTVVDDHGPARGSVPIAFASTDLFDRTGDDNSLVRHFFVWAVKNQDLAWFHIAAAGVDDPVFGMLLDRGVRLTTSHHTAVPISEYVLAQVLRARLPLDTMAADRAARRWQHAEWDEIAASRWLVIGLGHIGAEVARRARAFGAAVTGVRRTPTGAEPVDRMIHPDDVLAELGAHDVVVLATPATAATADMVDARFLAALGPGTILVNVGRGALVDEDALRSGLAVGQPATAILDVTRTEPLPHDHWLWDHPSVVLTAHTSASSRQRSERAAAVFADNLGRFLAGEPLTGQVTAEMRDAPAG